MTTRHDSRFERVKIKLAALLRHQGGLSAVEFSLFAPIFIIGLVTVADLGLAISQRMSMDHALRSGAQSAMADPGVEGVLATLRVTASDSFNVSAERYCVCPGDPGTKVGCSTVCTGSVPTRAFYSLWASGTYPGMIIPPITFRPEVRVQVR